MANRRKQAQEKQPTIRNSDPRRRVHANRQQEQPPTENDRYMTFIEESIRSVDHPLTDNSPRRRPTPELPQLGDYDINTAYIPEEPRARYYGPLDHGPIRDSTSSYPSPPINCGPTFAVTLSSANSANEISTTHPPNGNSALTSDDVKLSHRSNNSDDQHSHIQMLAAQLNNRLLNLEHEESSYLSRTYNQHKSNGSPHNTALQNYSDQSAKSLTRQHLARPIVLVNSSVNRRSRMQTSNLNFDFENGSALASRSHCPNGNSDKNSHKQQTSVAATTATTNTVANTDEDQSNRQQSAASVMSIHNILNHSPQFSSPTDTTAAEYFHLNSEPAETTAHNPLFLTLRLPSFSRAQATSATGNKPINYRILSRTEGITAEERAYHRTQLEQRTSVLNFSDDYIHSHSTTNRNHSGHYVFFWSAITPNNASFTPPLKPKRGRPRKYPRRQNSSNNEDGSNSSKKRKLNGREPDMSQYMEDDNSCIGTCTRIQEPIAKRTRANKMKQAEDEKDKGKGRAK